MQDKGRSTREKGCRTRDEEQIRTIEEVQGKKIKGRRIREEGQETRTREEEQR